MRIAVIDLGTNTFHILIADCRSGTHHILFKEKVPVKIGENGIQKGLINKEAESRAIKALKHFSVLIAEHKVKEVNCVATSAFRNAKNAHDIVEKVNKECGIRINIISGDEEAKLIFEGVKQAVRLSKKPSLILDIGGGSVEVIIANAENVLWQKSYEIGAQRLVDLFHKSDPILKTEIKQLNSYLRESLLDLEKAIKKFNPCALVGASGTFDTLVDIISEKGTIKKQVDQLSFEIQKGEFLDIYDDIILKNHNERLLIPGMIPMRVDMIVVAIQLIHFFLKEYDIEVIKTSNYALKEGLLSRMVCNEIY